MMDTMEMPNHNPFNKVQEDECSDLNLTSGTNHAFDELRSLKLEMESKGSLLGKTWSELSNIMTRYQARVIQKHEQLENSLTGANHSKLIQIEFELKKCRADNVSLQNNVTELKLNAIEKNAELMRKDNLIQKLQAQMRQETLDYQMEIKTLKDNLEQTKVHTDDQSLIPVSSLPVTSPQLKRRKASKTLVTRPPTDIDLLPWPTYSSPRPPASTSLGLSLCGTNSPLPPSANTEQLQNTSSQKPSTSQLTDQSEMDSSYTDQPFTEPQDDGSGQVFIELAEVDSNSEVEGSVQDASMVSEGMLPEGQEQTRSRRCGAPDSPVIAATSAHPCTSVSLQPSTPIKPEMLKCAAPCDFFTENSDNFEQHLKEKHGRGRAEHTCEECGKTYNHRSSLVYHQQTIHAAAVQVLCDACGKVYTSEAAMKKHRMNVHTRSEFVQCLICSKVFYSKIHLDSHLNMHENAKPYSCDKCDKRFANSGARNRHVKLCDQIDRPYQCKQCGAKFKRKGGLAVHSQKHQETSHACECGKTFRFRQNLSSHKKKKCTLLKIPE